MSIKIAVLGVTGVVGRVVYGDLDAVVVLCGEGGHLNG